MRTIRIASTLFATSLFCAACGGGQSQKTEKLDDLDETTTGPVDSSGGDGDGSAAGTAEGEGDGSGTPGDGDGTGDGDGDGSASMPAPPTGPAVTIKIKNSWTKNLEFNLTQGWGSRILMFSGKPPKAVSILPFAKACTASCEVEGKDRCPACKKPTSLGQIRKAQKAATTVVEPGQEIEVPWDGQVHKYEKTKVKGRKCDCHRLEPAPEETYSIRVCGLRLSKKHRKHSKLQCVTKEGALTFPNDGPQVFEFEFGDPAPPKKKKK